ncbi:MAG: RusA family crossover junction endodeoxyribonuclease [Candidatus Hodarchaeales archaeon]
MPDCLKNYEGKWITPPRNDAFNIQAQKYRIVKLNDEAQGLDCVFENGTPIRLHYWRFNHVIDMLREANGSYVPIGSSLNPEYNDNIEGSLGKKARDQGYPSAGLRTAPFVCDLIVLCGYAEYGYTINPRTDREVQGIKLRRPSVIVKVIEDPPNKQAKAYARTCYDLRLKLKEIKKDKLNNKLIDGPVKIEIDISSPKYRYTREGNDNIYLGDLDNLIGGIIDELKGVIIRDDSQVRILSAKETNSDQDQTQYLLKVTQIEPS